MDVGRSGSNRDRSYRPLRSLEGNGDAELPQAIEMIDLRRWIARSRRHRWLLPLVIVVLLLLAVLLVFHSWADAAEAGAGVACVLLGLLISVVVLFLPPRHHLRLVSVPARAPPCLACAVSVHGARLADCGLIPLRL